MWEFWIVLLIVFIVAEVATVNLVSIWFVFGSLAAIVADLGGWDLGRQILTFFVVSFLGLILFLLIFKPRVKRRKGPAERTNADRIIGQEAKVTIAIDPVNNSGQILVLGQEWSAIPEDGESKLAVGTMVVVKEIRGVKAVVKPHA